MDFPGTEDSEMVEVEVRAYCRVIRRARYQACHCTGVPALITAPPQRKVLESLQRHWDGLTVFVEHPDVSMDNQARHYFSRKLKWDPSDFSGEKSRGG